MGPEQAEDVRGWLRSAERAAPEEQWTLLCFLAGRGVALDAGERNAAVRRAQLLLATGGDPRRPLELYGRAVTALAADLDDPARRADLQDGLEALAAAVEGLRGLGEALRVLVGDTDLAWQAFAMAVLGEALADEETDADD
jgi:hypothetical protein